MILTAVISNIELIIQKKKAVRLTALPFIFTN